MNPCQIASPEDARYFFTRVKDTYTENGLVFITLFIRLTKEYTSTNYPNKQTKQIWTEIEEVLAKQTPKKIQSIRKGIQIYEVPEGVFQELSTISATCPDELYTVIPFSEGSSFKPFH